ncbi:MAG: hypothetical protein V2I36_18715 [Desulfopila sp.]|nr:hypothetical protein [Desulfopila sp.]
MEITFADGQRLVEMRTISTSIEVHADSPWFSGHFPDKPVLPGIAQLKMVADFIRASVPRAGRISSVRRVKFRKLITPGEQLDIEVTFDNRNDHYLFSITSGNDTVCSGKMLFTQIQHNVNS